MSAPEADNSPTGTNPEPAESAAETLGSDLSKSIEETQILLAHAARHGKAIETEMVSSLVHASRSYRTGDWTPEAETRFWMDFNKLSRTVRPVTIPSLLAARGKESRVTVWFYRSFTFVVLLTLVALQIYWFTGHEIIRDMDLQGASSAFMQWKPLYQQFDSSTCEPNAEASEPALCPELRRDEKRAWESYEVSKYRVDTTLALLNSWNSVWRTVSPWGKTVRPRETMKEIKEDLNTLVAQIPEDGDDDSRRARRIEDKIDEVQETLADLKTSLTGAFGADSIGTTDELKKRQKELVILTEEVQRGSFALRALSDYVLPLVYGLLGALAYVLRSLTRRIREQSFLKEMNTGYGLRLHLGALAGLAIGWFLSPEDLSSGMLSFSSPWALAFVAGYSVEILFAQLDRLVNAFTQPRDEGSPANPGTTG